ncbi:hypothetical protein G5T42_15530 [Microbacterium sp. 4R-513]|uniref:hypothetical protein n=1 Tax=Microbacterium sp. 4R-513 TaxID=2567934 RepID=UPI0013E1542F|nr:hypothetical protein [Microbacterium sp. 4R-513]QIG40706.1 hypothetical protein G5T42_15530 [Microbacterium sp. 4R-513]
MSLFFSRHLRLLSASAAAVWLIILGVSVFSFATSTLAFDDVAYYSASAVLGAAILCTTAVLLGVQARASIAADERVRGAGLLGIAAALLAVVFVFAIPGWATLFIWAVAATVIRSRDTSLTSPRMRVVVLAGLGVCALSIPVTAFLAVTGDVLGAALWGTLVVLSLVLLAWHVEVAMRAAAPSPSTSQPPAPV